LNPEFSDGFLKELEYFSEEEREVLEEYKKSGKLYSFEHEENESLSTTYYNAWCIVFRPRFSY